MTSQAPVHHHQQQLDDAALKARLKDIKIFDKKWEVLQDVLQPLYQKESCSAIAKMMKHRFGFDASEEMYKYRFNRVWKWHKNSTPIPAKVKEIVLAKAHQRASQNKDTRAEYRKRKINPASLQYGMRSESKKDALSISQLFHISFEHSQVLGSYSPFGSSLLLSWNMPFGVGSTTSASTPPWTNTSPAVLDKTPSDVDIRTPSDAITSPSGVPPPDTVASSLAPVVRDHRLKLFLQGNTRELLRSLSEGEQRTLSIYFYQFWFYAFVAAQNWCLRPEKWTAEKLGFTDLQSSVLGLSDSNSLNMPSSGSGPRDLVPLPPMWCRWTLHLARPDVYFGLKYQDKPAERAHEVPHVTTTNVSTMDQELCDSLRANSFSSITSSELPLPIPLAANKAQKNPSELLQEAVAFAVMGRNLDLLRDLLERAEAEDVDLTPIHPLHIATSYLDGGTVCCLIVCELCRYAIGGPIFRNYSTNDYGHTVLDNLFLTILRSHSNTPLNAIDENIGSRGIYAGQQVDICGRWSADSGCYRALVASGQLNVPFTWKHKFCHTSAQAVCHSISIILTMNPVKLQGFSGLFSRRCVSAHCGKLLQLSPLHALVATGFYLAINGCVEEDLFGILACYLCLVDGGIDPLVSVDISVKNILETNIFDECEHIPRSPSELAREFQLEMHSRQLPQKIVEGWNTLLAVMVLTEDARNQFEDARNQFEDARNQFEELATAPCTTRYLCVFNNVDYEHYLMRMSELVENILRQQQLQREQLERSFPRKCKYPCNHAVQKTDPGFGNSPVLGHIWAAVQAELSAYRRVSEQDDWLSPWFSMSDLFSSLKNNTITELRYLKDGKLKPYCRCGRFQDSQSGLPSREDVLAEQSLNVDESENAWNRTSFICVPDTVV